MNMFDEARSLFGMVEMCKMTQSELAKKLGRGAHDSVIEEQGAQGCPHVILRLHPHHRHEDYLWRCPPLYGHKRVLQNHLLVDIYTLTEYGDPYISFYLDSYLFVI